MGKTENHAVKRGLEMGDLERLQPHVSAASRLMKIMASEPRLIILCRLSEGECSVGELADYSELAQSTASQHLTRLRSEGVVETRREGQTIYYRLVDTAAMRIIDALCDIYGNKRSNRRKRKVLS